MDLSLVNVGLAFGAGLASILSPCVLPVVPIIVTGTEKDSKLRPVAIVLGLALAFVAMGVVSSLFGSLVLSKMVYVEKVAGAIIVLFGLLMLFDVNVFKKLTFFNNIGGGGRGGLLGALMLGASLGIVWIPCVGPMLSSVLTMVATKGQLVEGVILLLIYSAGFAVPMLIVAWSSQLLRDKFRSLSRSPVALRLFSATVLVALGLYIVFKGAVIIT